MRHLAFTVYGTPQGKQRPRLGKGGRVYTPKSTKTYEAAVRARCLCAMVAGRVPKRCGGAVRITIGCFFPDARRRDGDNVLKAVQDALNGFLWVDDCQVCEATVRTAIDRACPRTEVAVELGAPVVPHLADR
jgi:Holliday junction resolvase RusA-like endonuclease